MIEALEKSLGVVSNACAQVNLSRRQHYDWMKDDEEYRKAVLDVKNICLDFAESKLFSQMKKENMTAIIYYLKCHGKDRGYTEQSSSSVDLTSDGGPIVPFIIQKVEDGTEGN